ncbi:BLUF domain-containing protein [Glaciecola petra]|uniref:BLUF domain-containing protein n=1 Tax=Glaciecola petra TaxID=3075602 RepID=A0ABU2ZP78_9ALTE|nr:BLUF domain-containing protein [Aestuariibacter sp. P117]MDT0593257.1 BLUF domain-containing protein [Aestuariibacter sp. P117]
MKSLIYLSLSRNEFSESDLVELAKTSANKNAEVGITGFLCYQNGRFIQYIEGPEDKLELLMSKIRQDKRHKILTELISSQILEKRFPAWGMALLKEENLTEFNFEESIERNLMYIKNEFLHKDISKKIVWQHVSLIGQLHMSKLNLQEDKQSKS